MNKFMKKTVAGLLTMTLVATAAVPAFAAEQSAATDPYVNSVGSTVADFDTDVVTENDYASGTVTGNDSNQTAETEYSIIASEETDVVEGEEVLDFVTAPQTHKTDVYVTIAEGEDVLDEEGNTLEGQVLVSIPNKVILNGEVNAEGNYAGEYLVKVKGNIAGNTVINVVPQGAGDATEDGETSFIMTQNGKHDITAYVDQAAIKFIADNIITGEDVVSGVHAANDWTGAAQTSATVYTDEATAGSWHGTFNFVVSAEHIVD